MKIKSLIKHNLMRAAMTLALILACATAWAQTTQSVTYIDENGQQQTVDATLLTASTYSTNMSGWYVASGTFTNNNRLMVNYDYATLNLILADDCHLTMTKGLQVPSHATLNIYSQSKGSSMGKLTITAPNNYAGIGGSANPNQSIPSGNINIYGGDLNITGGSGGAGIGGGRQAAAQGAILITNGAKVVATGGFGGAGIGGGYQASFSSITITGNATVTASATNGGEAIGRGQGASQSGTLSITNSTVNNVHYDADGFQDGSTHTVTFNSQGGTAVAAQTVGLKYGQTIVKANEPTVPTRTYYVFGGWYKESNCTNAWDFDNDAVTEDITLYAKWTPDPDHFSVSDDGNTYTIHTATGWGLFCDALQDNDTYNRFSGDTVKLANNITVTRMAGSSQHDFCGTFDGDGKTLTVSYGSADEPINAQYVAPFLYTTDNNGSMPKFRNLTIDGNIYEAYTGSEDHHHVGGLIGHLYGTVTIEHCTSNVTITSTGGAGGFVGLCEHTVNFNDCVSSAVIHSAGGNNSGFIGWSRDSGYNISFAGCVFNGKLLKVNDNSKDNGGFIGWKGDSKNVTITNCLVDPAPLGEGETMANGNSATFSREHSDHAATINNCYYTTAFGTPQGKQMHSITAGDSYVTVANAGMATTYSVSGITSYGTGILYDNVLYAGNGDVVSLTLSNSSSGDVPEGYQYVYSTNAGTLDGSTLTMPDADVIVSAALRSTGQPVDGIGYYINNEYRFWEAIALDGTESSLGISGKEKWYFVGTDISHSGTILCSGNVNIILAYGKTMTITSSDGDGIDVNGSLTIYGQDYITGTLNVNSNYTGINSYSGNITISGGTVNATGNNTGGIYSSGNITISDSRVTATGGSYGIRSNSGNITIGCAYASDFIYASSYVVGSEGTLNIAYGKAFKDVDGHTYSGTIDQVDGAYPIDGKRLYPDCVAMKHITGYGNSTESDHWVFIASPVVDNIAPSEVHNLFPSAGETSNDYDLYRFNQSDDNGNEWQNWKATTTENHPDFTSLVIGQGYLYATKEDRMLVFSGEYPSGTYPVEVPLDYDENANLAGWNLVGNPFATGATLSQPFYRMNPEGTALSAQVEAGNTVEAMEGVFVQATGDDQTVTFTAQTRGGEKAAIAQANIMVGGDNGAVIDNAIIRFDGGQTLEKFSFREGSTKLYIPQGGKDYAIACSNGQGEMPLNFRAKENGTYTITVNVDHVEMSYLHLIDNLTGADVDLLASPTYTFTAKTTDYESRFKLVFSRP
ncbi:MAG: InlB B-repeat-containing protein [Bacteroidales bacterium]|nr:InlB B-repeat-containing protein [Bacteroidales bacterium]